MVAKDTNCSNVVKFFPTSEEQITSNYSKIITFYWKVYEVRFSSLLSMGVSAVYDKR